MALANAYPFPTYQPNYNNYLPLTHYMAGVGGPYEDPTTAYLWCVVPVYARAGAGAWDRVVALRSTDAKNWTEHAWFTPSAAIDPGNCASLFDSANRKVYLAGGMGGVLVVLVLDMATGVVSQYSTGTGPSGSYVKGIVRRSDGSMVLVYMGPNHSSMGTQYSSCHYVCLSSAGAWGTAVELDPGGAASFQPMGAVLGPSDRVHMFYCSTSGTTPGVGDYHRSGTGSGTTMTLDASAVKYVTGSYHNSVQGLYSSRLSKVVFVDSAGTVRRFTSGAVPTITADGTSPLGGHTLRNNAVLLDYPTDGLLRCIFTNNDGDISIMSSQDAGSGWETPVVRSTAYLQITGAPVGTDEVQGDGGTNERYAQTFSISENHEIKSVVVSPCYTVNKPTPSDYLIVELRDGSQTGTLLATSTNAVYARNSGENLVAALFSSPVALTANHTYCIVVRRSGARDTANVFGLNRGTSSQYAGGVESQRDNGVWSDKTYDMHIGVPFLRGGYSGPLGASLSSRGFANTAASWGGAPGSAVLVEVPPAAFTMDADYYSTSVTWPGDAVPDITLTLTLGSGANQLATMSTGPLPKGVSVYFQPSQVYEDGGQSVMYTSVATAWPGTYTIRVYATDADNNQAYVDIELVINGNRPTPVIELTPAGDPVGYTVAITGDWFDPNTSFSATIDGSPLTLSPAPLITDADGSFGKSFVVPNLPVGDYTIRVTDANNNWAEHLFSICTEVNYDDTYTNETPIVGHLSAGPLDTYEQWLDSPTNRWQLGTPLNTVKAGGYYWTLCTLNGPYGVTWDYNVFPPPSPADYHAYAVIRWALDGTSRTVYWLSIEPRYSFEWLVDAYLFYGDWRGHINWVDWSYCAIDAQLATDGTNVWVGVTAVETQTFPEEWVSTDDGFNPPDNPHPNPQINQYETLDALIARTGYTSWTHYTHEPSMLPSESDYPPCSWSGNAYSNTWNPGVFIMFAWNGSGFSRIGDIRCKYGQWGGGRYDSDVCEGGHCSGVELAASSAEAGVCHAVFSESGVWGMGQRGSGSLPNPQYDVWDRGWPWKGSRLVYSRWSSSAKTFESDLEQYDLDRSAWYTLVDGYKYSKGWTDPAHTAQVAFTMCLKNEHGSCCALVCRPLMSEFVGSYGQTYWGPNKAEAAWRYWDLSSGAIVERRVMPSSLLPTAAEMARSSSPPPTNPTVPDRLYLTWPIGQPGWGSGGYHVARHNWTNTGWCSSTVKFDWTSAGKGVYYLLGAFWESWNAVDGSRVGEGWYKIPVDGSANFSLLMRRRDAIPMNEFYALGFQVPKVDFFAEPRNLWLPVYGSIVWACDLSDCGHGWSWIDKYGHGTWAGQTTTNDANKPDPYYGVMYPDPDADHFRYFGQWGASTGSTYLYESGIAQTHIWRNAHICGCGEPPPPDAQPSPFPLGLRFRSRGTTYVPVAEQPGIALDKVRFRARENPGWTPAAEQQGVSLDGVRFRARGG